MLVTISTILGALAAVVAILKDGPRVVIRRGPAVVGFLQVVAAFLLQRKGFVMVLLLLTSSLLLGTHFATEANSASPGDTSLPAGQASPAESAQLSEDNRPLVLCVPPFTLDTAETRSAASSREGRAAARQMYAILEAHRTPEIKITSDDDVALTLDRIDRDNTGLYDEKTQIRVGNLLNATRMIIGEIDVASVRDNRATLAGRDVHTRVADVSLTVAVFIPETLERTCVRSLSGRAPFVVSPGSEPPTDDALIQRAIAAALQKLANDEPFIAAATSPITALSSVHSPSDNP